MATLSEHLALARSALKAGDAAQAEQVCRSVLAKLPKHVEATYRLAAALLAPDAGRPTTADGRRKTEDGRRRWSGGRPPSSVLRPPSDAAVVEAEDLLHRVLSADPGHRAARALLARLLIENGDRDGARREIAYLVELAPTDPEARAMARELGLADWPERPLSRAALAHSYAKAGLFRRAAAEFLAALDTDAGRLDLWTGLIEAQWLAGQLDHAVANVRGLAATAPDCLEALVVLAASAGPEGGQYWERIRALDPAQTVAHRLLVASPVSPPPPDDPEI